MRKSLELFETYRLRFREVTLILVGTEPDKFHEKHGVGNDSLLAPHLRGKELRWYFDLRHANCDTPIHCCAGKKPYLDLNRAIVQTPFEFKVYGDVSVAAQMEKMCRLFEEKILEGLFAGRRFFMDPRPVQKEITSIWQYSGNRIEISCEGDPIPALHLEDVICSTGQWWGAFIPPGPECDEITAALSEEKASPARYALGHEVA